MPTLNSQLFTLDVINPKRKGKQTTKTHKPGGKDESDRQKVNDSIQHTSAEAIFLAIWSEVARANTRAPTITVSLVLGCQVAEPRLYLRVRRALPLDPITSDKPPSSLSFPPVCSPGILSHWVTHTASRYRYSHYTLCASRGYDDWFSQGHL